MKKVVYISLFLCIISATYAQDDIKKDSFVSVLEDYRQLDSFKVYYKSVQHWEEYLKDSNNLDSLEVTEKYYDYLPSNSQDSFEYRKHLTRHANKLKKYLNKKFKANTYYELAHDYVVDDTLLDEWCKYSEKSLASNYSRQNDFNKAIYYYKKCIKCYEKYYPKELSRIYSDLGGAYLWVGDENSMRKYYNLGLRDAEINDESRGLQAIHNRYAEYYITEGYHVDSIAIAKTHLEFSAKFLKRLTSDPKYYRRKAGLLDTWGDYFAKIGDYDQGIANYNQAIEIYKANASGSIDRSQGKVYHKIALFYFAKEDLDLSDGYIQKAFRKLTGDKIVGLPKSFQISKENTLVDLILLKSEIYLANSQAGSQELKYIDSLLMSVNLAIHTNEMLDNDLELDQSRYVSSSVHKDIVNMGIKGSYKAYETSKLVKYKDQARKLFDISKGRTLHRNRDKALAYTLLSKEEKLKVNQLKDRLIALEKDSHENKNIDSIEISFIDINKEIDDILLQNRVDNDSYELIEEPYLDYVLADSMYYLYTNIGVQNFYKIGSQKVIDDFIHKVFSALENKIIDRLDDISHQLYDLLIPISMDDIDYVNILPDGILTTFPFDILKYEHEYLTNHVSYSIRYNMYAAKKIINEDNIRGICILNPQYEMSGDLVSSDRSSLGPLPFANIESASIAKIFDVSQESIESEVESSYLRKMLEGKSIFHYAGHAKANADESYLAVNNKGLLEKITPDQIKYMTNSMDLVTLSACETGLGQFNAGEGMKSLASSFVESGAQSVLYSLWKVDDESTSTLMSLFYRELKAGKSKDKALRMAKLSYLENCSPEKRHPYYWSGFVLAGSTAPIYEANSQSLMWSIIGVLLIIMAFIYFKTKTKPT